MKNLTKSLVIACTAIMLSGCAGIVSLPGGTETVNKSFYKSDQEMKERVSSLQEGMTKDEVLRRLNRNESQLIVLRRDEIIDALYGGDQFGIIDVAQSTQGRNYIKSLSGYRLVFKNVERNHGLNSPISMRTNQEGYSYSTTLIFKDNVLYEKPMITGGVVDESSTRTLFDYISLGTAMNHVGI